MIRIQLKTIIDLAKKVANEGGGPANKLDVLIDGDKISVVNRDYYLHPAK